ncbi:2-dehydro-3-deoxygalactonokinase [Pelagibacterium halotolerans]|uniref:2-dehydro-3-deoxygalactonokinase n=1 Tax=Pelagibacterium halotolerans (strain DSM 22347 / JCM 15775 / CGMCC 1.7692 / B2) TaxID=1082931 RepID=G4R7W2_PELHB|nr:2-dehydro-3-deoxygalactonokinase [Pelagibacterium halotolerans]AEQ50257.1 2-dehydro-3-deoxygalactonokinase [Pelagibacterium halotolerans B2]QJR19749.1 2-dehydro-3-deoxygalactonokinase [Pelagibacterium halotolerans]SEA52077.1 2-dehydro-3-deoxygalactonokinase [Pelagibacterium halotolerans]
MPLTADWIALDWGTSNMRAWAMGADNSVLARGDSAKGMGQLSPSEFEPALLDIVEQWLDIQRVTPVIGCGMVGARQGWIEAEYAKTPTPPIATAPTRAPAADRRISVFILPGVSQSAPPDVMRGEETQIAGYVAAHGTSGILCLPGTHSKWVEIADGRIARFRTAMTGEIFALLAEKSVLRHSVGTGEWSNDGFASGVSEALGDPEIVTKLFSIRAGSLLEGTSPQASRSRLSGLLIGSELAGTIDYWRGKEVALIGASQLSTLYRKALAIAGVSARLFDAEEMTLAGLCAARAALEDAQ